jgi:hypothetical protein
MTDQELLEEIQYHMLETPNDGASWTSDMWNEDEVASYLNGRQQRFMVETGIIISRATLVTIPNTPRHALPQDWISTRRMVWKTYEDVYTPVPKMTWEIADNGVVTWPYDVHITRPTGYIEPDDMTRTLEVHVVPAIQDGGVLQTWYVALPTPVDATGVSLTAPDECASIIKWGVMADMLSKPSRAHDPERAQYCEMRWQEGIDITKSLLARYE